MAYKGYEKVFSKVEGEHGIDGLYIKCDANGNVRALDNDPVMQGLVIGCYDIGADCYDFFVCTKEKLVTLSKLAKEIDQRICLCSEC